MLHRVNICNKTSIKVMYLRELIDNNDMMTQCYIMLQGVTIHNKTSIKVMYLGNKLLIGGYSKNMIFKLIWTCETCPAAVI